MRLQCHLEAPYAVCSLRQEVDGDAGGDASIGDTMQAPRERGNDLLSHTVTTILPYPNAIAFVKMHNHQICLGLSACV